MQLANNVLQPFFFGDDAKPSKVSVCQNAHEQYFGLLIMWKNSCTKLGMPNFDCHHDLIVIIIVIVSAIVIITNIIVTMQLPQGDKQAHLNTCYHFFVN